MANQPTIIVLLILINLLWLPQAIHQIFVWTYWWQVKEYRLDRFLVFLKTKDGRYLLGVNKLLLKLVAFVLAYKYPVALFTTFFLLDLGVLKDLLTKNIRRPVVTKRMQKILATCFVGILLTLFSFYFYLAKALVLGEFLLIVTPYVGILWTNTLVKKAKANDIESAKKILEKVTPIVVGVTGSYGKTTTKDFIAHLLSTKFKVSKTTGSQNTEFGLARSIINNLKKGDKFFIAEYGAYKIGEIKSLTDVARPEIAVITSVEPQHLEIFGSLENIKKAKYELVEALGAGGLAIFNINDTGAKELYLKAKRNAKNIKLLTYQLFDHEDFNADIIAKIDDINEKIRFTINLNGEECVLVVSLPSEQLVTNLLPGILIARMHDISWSNIQKALDTLETPDATLKIIKRKDFVVIDDSHNSSPTGFKTAVKKLKDFPNVKKIIITSGIIELGDHSEKIHTELAHEIKELGVEKIYLTKRDHLNVFKKILGEKVVYLKKVKQLKKEFDNGGKKLILLEGRVPSFVNSFFKF